jgi:LuxR family maltose regulon positive regulatory protein
VRRGTVAAAGLLQPLTSREHEVPRLPAAGHPHRRSPTSCSSRSNTVKRHISHVFDKMQVANRTQAVARA